MARPGKRSDSTEPAWDVVPVTPGSSALPDGPCRAILATVGGTVNITSLAGVERNAVPITAGIPLPVWATHIRSGGSATGIFALY